MRCRLGLHAWRHEAGRQLMLTAARIVQCKCCGRRERWTYYLGERFDSVLLDTREEVE